MPLTDVAIRKAGPSSKAVRLFDEKGLYLEISPSGGKWWRLKYRIAGKEKRISLGVYPEVGLAEARKRRDKAREKIAEGTDPSEARRAVKAERAKAALSTFEPVARAWLEQRAAAWTERTLTMITASLERHAFPRLGHRPVSQIEPREVREVVKAIDEAGAGETAGRVFQRIKAVYRYAIAHDLAEVDPTYSLKPGEILKPRRAAHRAAIAESDAPRFLAALEAYEGDPTTRLALQLLVLTATRPGELRGARWHEIDEQRALWRIPADRMKMKSEHTVPLSRQALATLGAMKPLSGRGTLVFPSPFYPDKPLSENTLNSALARMGYKGIATAHGFRTLFSTSANEAGWNSDVIEKQLAHEERNDVRGAYNRAQWLKERTELMQWWGDRLDALRKGARVLPFKAA